MTGLLLRYLSAAVGFVQIPITTNLMAPDDRGLAVWIIGLSSFAALLTSFSAHNGIHGRHDVATPISDLVCLHVLQILVLPAILIGSFIIFEGNEIELSHTMCVLIGTLILIQIFEWSTREVALFLGDLDSLIKVIFVTCCLQVALVGGALLINNSAESMLVGMALSKTPFLLYFKNKIAPYFEFLGLKKLVRGAVVSVSSSKKLYASALVTGFSGQADVIFLGGVIGAMSAISYYHVAVQLMAGVLIVAQYGAMKIYSLREGARNFEEFFNTALTKALNYLLILTALSLFAAFMLRNFWVFLGDGYEQSLDYFYILLFAVPGLGIRYLAEPFLNIGEKHDQILLLAIVSSSFGILAAFVGVTTFGAYGASVAIVLTSILSGGMALVFVFSSFGTGPSAKK